MAGVHAIGIPEMVAGIIVLALNAYVLTGGADFGGGVWDLLAWGPRRKEQRALIAQAIGPIWEANHVWLIIVIVMLFTAFPSAFATVSVVLHIPLSLMLVGIVLRGSAFVFRSYGSRAEGAQRRGGRVFSIASATTPILLGVTIGAIASGAVGDASRLLSASKAEAPSSFLRVFVVPWASPFPMLVGLTALTLFAYLAAIYLAVAAQDDALREDFRRCALGAALATFVVAGAALAVAFTGAPAMSLGLTGATWSVPLQVAIALAAVSAIAALWRRRYRLARAAAAGQLSLMLWGWAFAQYPYLVPRDLTIRAAAAPAIALELLLWGLGGGVLILAPSLIYLFRTFAAAEKGDS